jgi:hypothetical protein
MSDFFWARSFMHVRHFIDHCNKYWVRYQMKLLHDRRASRRWG